MLLKGAEALNPSGAENPVATTNVLTERKLRRVTETRGHGSSSTPGSVWPSH